MKRYSSIFEVARIIAIVFASAVIIRFFLFQPFIVEGSSMEPNYHNGEYLFIEKVSYRFNEPKRGDVVVFQYPFDQSINYIKRVVGLPGDALRIEEGKVYINGQLVSEGYLSPGEQTLVSRNPDLPYEVKIPEGRYFVMGDNRHHSSDSREGWLLTRDLIIGRSAAVLYSNNGKAVASPGIR